MTIPTQSRRTVTGWIIGARLLGVMAFGGLIAFHLQAVGRADVDLLSDGNLTREGATTEIHRLPPTDAAQENDTDTNGPHGNHLPAGRLFYMGYDSGFVVGADQVIGDYADAVAHLMRVNSWAQLRHTFFDSEGANRDQNSFSFERLRLSFAGHVFTPDLGYFFQFDGNSDRSTRAIFLDYFVKYDVGRHLYGCTQDKLGIKFGKWKVPFSRSRGESGRQLQFTDRATANVFFDLNRSLGVGLYRESDGLGVPLHFEMAIFNGFKTGSANTDRVAGEIDRNCGWSFRSYTDLLSEFGADGEPDLSWHCWPTLRIGGGGAYTRVDNDGTDEFNRQRGVDSGDRLAGILPVGVTAYDVWFATVDAHLKYHGLAFIAEYYWRHIAHFGGGSIPRLSDDGFVIQAGYFVVPQRLELLIRWSRIAGDSGTLSLLDQSSDEVAGGFAWYIRGHNVKLTLDVTHLNGTPVSDARLNVVPRDAGWLFRTQAQVAF